MARVTVDDLKCHHGVEDHQLQLQCQDQHLEQLAHKIPNWLSIAVSLGLKEHQQQAIRVNLDLDYLHKTVEALKVWKRNDGRDATYLRLVKACLEMSNAVLAGDVCELAKSATRDGQPHSLESWFRDIGLTQRDIEVLVEEGFSTKQAFKFLTRPELNNLGLTRGGVRILEAQIEKTSTSESTASSGTSDSNVHIREPKAEQSTEYLSPNTHLKHVYRHTFAAHTKWFNIGLQLGLAKHTLDSIGRNRSLHDDGDYYREMLTSWMQGGLAKMEELLEVLEGPTVEMKDVVRHVNSLRDDQKRQIGLRL